MSTVFSPASTGPGSPRRAGRRSTAAAGLCKAAARGFAFAFALFGLIRGATDPLLGSSSSTRLARTTGCLSTYFFSPHLCSLPDHPSSQVANEVLEWQGCCAPLGCILDESALRAPFLLEAAMGF